MANLFNIEGVRDLEENLASSRFHYLEEEDPTTFEAVMSSNGSLFWKEPINNVMNSITANKI